MTEPQKKIKVCVIGGGAAGLCALRHLSADMNYFEPEAFEQTEDIGGTWVYTEKTGLDENGLPIHTSMYRDLRTVVPCEIMNFPDFRRMKGDKGSCVHRQIILSYLRDYAQHFQIRQFIKFNTKVENVKPETIQNDTGSTIIWHVQVKNLKTNQIIEKKFDAVMVCSGHYFQPNIPTIPGIETFPGKILHSHFYRKPEDFSRKTVMILGAGPSGVDIGIQLSSVADKIYLSHYHERIVSILPPNLIQIDEIERVEGTTFFTKDGSSISANAFLYSTGYVTKFSFLHENCKITVDNNYVSPLYKHMINVHYPTMCFMGINPDVVEFPVFHIQAQYFLALLKKKCNLPSKEEMLEDSKLKTSEKKYAHKLYELHFKFFDFFAKEAAIEPIPAIYEKAFDTWVSCRLSDRWHHKDYKIIISEDDKDVQLISYQ